MSVELKTLINKLNAVSRQATLRAATLCMNMGHFEITPEHVLLAFLEQAACDITCILRASKLRVEDVRQALNQALAGFPKGNTRTPVFSVHLQSWLEHAWLIASLELGQGQAGVIRSGHCLQALLVNHTLAQLAYQAVPAFKSISVEALKHQFNALTVGAEEAVPEGAPSTSVDEAAASSSSAMNTPFLQQYTVNLTQLAKDGSLDPVIGRDAEIRQMIDILMRRRQNNPILTGEPGVGKTAVVEGLALRVAKGDVPEVLREVSIHVLDMGLLQAGASVKGEFEQRLNGVMNEVKQSVTPIILFIDEAHTIIGAGGQAGQNDAANLLKPALARGELRTIAATTWAEYKKYFEKDAALARRFQVVKVEEPSEEVACAMLRGMVSVMERHFQVRILDEAIQNAVRLSQRFIIGRQLPDKAVSILDTACAKVALGQSSTPSAIERVQALMQQYQTELDAVLAEQGLGLDHQARISRLEQQLGQAQAELQQLQAQWHQERALVNEIVALRQQLDGASRSHAAEPIVPDDARQQWVAQMAEKQAALAALQGEQPMVALQVDGSAVAEIVASWTGVPLGKMRKNELQTVLELHDVLEQRVIGQSHAIRRISERVQTAWAQLDDPNKPKGIFMLVGPSGVGKTETALAMAEALYGGEHKLVTINMSEYQEAHSVSGLKGSPPGYVGYSEGGVLTEAVRRNPYCVVLLDEVEKAHPDVMELFFQVFDKGVLEDAEGRVVDFKNTMILLTSNIGSSQMMQASLNKVGGERPSAEMLDSLIRPLLVKAFKPALLGRLHVIPYYPLEDDVLADIIRMKLASVSQRFDAFHQASLRYTDAVVGEILARCTEVDSGARNIEAIINHALLPPLSMQVLQSLSSGQSLKSIKVSLDKKRQFRYQVDIV